MGKFVSMDPELKAEWVAKLRSGEYKQGRLRLCQEINGTKKWCCIGVLADLIDSSRWKLVLGSPDFGWENGELLNISTLPTSEWYRVLNTSNETIVQGIESDLWYLNDEERQSFNYIADWIDENL